MAVVELEIPSRPEYVAVVRLAVASLARQAGMEEETVDELRIALSEACTTAVMTHAEAGVEDPVQVTWEADDAEVKIVVTSKTLPESASDTGSTTMSLASRLIMSQALLESLATSVQMDHTDSTQKTSLTFSL